MPEKLLAKEKKPFVARWVRVVLLVYLVLTVPHIILSFFSVQYFPSPDWLIKARPFDIALSVAVLCFISAVCFRLWKKQRSSSARWDVFWQWLSFSMFPAWLVLHMGSGAVTYGFPMIVSAFAGQDTELSYVVKWRANLSSEGRCPYSIYLDGVPSPWQRFCNLPEELVTTVRRGDTIIVSGKGTSMGLYADSAALSTDS